MTVAAACPSSAWVLGVVARARVAARALPAARRRKTCGATTPATLISSSYAPTGQGRARRGRLPRQRALVVLERLRSLPVGRSSAASSRPRRRASRRRCARSSCRASDYRIDDNWHVAGLKGDGQQGHRRRGRVRPRAPHAPAHRRLQAAEPRQRGEPGAALPAALRADLRALGLDVGHRHRRRARSTRSATSPPSASPRATARRSPRIRRRRLVCARAPRRSSTRCALVLHRNFDEMMAARARRRGHPPRAARALPATTRRTRSSSASRPSTLLFTASGGRAIFLGSPILRYFLDVHAARAHYANNPDKPGAQPRRRPARRSRTRTSSSEASAMTTRASRSSATSASR